MKGKKLQDLSEIIAVSLITLFSLLLIWWKIINPIVLPALRDFWRLIIQ